MYLKPFDIHAYLCLPQAHACTHKYAPHTYVCTCIYNNSYIHIHVYIHVYVCIGLHAHVNVRPMFIVVVSHPQNTLESEWAGGYYLIIIIISYKQSVVVLRWLD